MIILTLIIWGTTVKDTLHVPNFTILPARFNKAKIVYHPKGKFLAALFLKELTLRIEDEYEGEKVKVGYGARLEVWELDKNMYPYRLLFRESEQPWGVAAIIPHLIWVGDNLLYTVVTHFPSLTHFQSLKEVAEYACQGTKDPFEVYKKHYELRLWFPGANRAKVVRKGICGISSRGKEKIFPMPIEGQFLLLDPGDEWDKVISGMPREEIRHRYWWERIIQICKIERREVKVIKTLHVRGVDIDHEVIGFTSNGRLLVLRAYFNPQMIKSPSFFGGPPYLLVDLTSGSVSVWEFGNKISEEIGIKFGLLSTNEIIVLKGIGEMEGVNLNIKYIDLEGNILKEYTITKEQFKKMIGETIGYDTYERLKKLRGIVAPLYEAWTPDGRKLVMHDCGYVWSLDIDSLTMKLITKGVWIEKALQWIDNRYLVIQWCPYPHKVTLSWGILKID
jgi:hypothetical protein